MRKKGINYQQHCPPSRELGLSSFKCVTLHCSLQIMFFTPPPNSVHTPSTPLWQLLTAHCTTVNMEGGGEALPVRRQVYTCMLTWWIYVWTCLARACVCGGDIDSARQTIKPPCNRATEEGVILHRKWGRSYPPWHTNKLFAWFTSTLPPPNGNRRVHGVRGLWCKREYSTYMAASVRFSSACHFVSWSDAEKQRSWSFYCVVSAKIQHEPLRMLVFYLC